MVDEARRDDEIIGMPLTGSRAATPCRGTAYLDGRILCDSKGVLAELNDLAQRHFETYRTPPKEAARIAFLLQCSRDRIAVALAGGDLLKATFVAGTSSWGIIEGLWAANGRPLPPNSSVRAHLGDLSVGPPKIEERYRQPVCGSRGSQPMTGP